MDAGAGDGGQRVSAQGDGPGPLPGTDGRRDAPIREAMCRDCAPVSDTESLTQTLESMRQRGCASVPVLANKQIVGLLTLENISEVLMVNAALAHGQSQRLETR